MQIDPLTLTHCILPDIKKSGRPLSECVVCSELVRYRQFLGIQNEDKNIAETRSQGTPADR